MILCIESWKGDTYLTGKKRSYFVLSRQIQQTENS